MHASASFANAEAATPVAEPGKTADNSRYTNISSYKFVTIEDTAEQRPVFRAKCEELNLKGTILLTPEGINMFLCGEHADIAAYLAWLRSDARFADIEAKYSYSDNVPFKRMLVKLKKEIITMRMPLIKPELGRAPVVDAKTLKRWLDQGRDDEGREVVMMETRNAFEVDVGTFENTLDYRISKFTEFPAVAEAHRAELADKTVVTFCTGGIRCEKAAIHMKNIGYEHLYQLEGGILKYFEEVGGAHYKGDCFVFDYRTALKPDLSPSETTQCFACRAVVTPIERESEWYVAGHSCPHCRKQQRA
ncbi:sulfurtransferase [Massilia sp. W12]|uniref:sulfurtransferase n=1 Tax=Massilia sp. W12 TaxID=3126507 RepID=UPI0030D28D09